MYAFRNSSGPVAAAGGRVIVDDESVVAIADIGPEVAGLDPFAVVILDLHRRVVGADHLRGQDPSGHLADDRLEQLGDGGHPVAHRRAGQLDAVPLEDPF